MKKKKQVDVGNAKVLPRGDYVKTIKSIIASGFCPFCEEHLFKHHSEPILFQNRYWLVTENSWPYEGARFHFLFIAREHIEKTEDMSLPMLLDLHNLYKQLVKHIKVDGATLMIRSGNTQVTGASVNHLHAHFIVGSPRKRNSKPIKALVGFEF